MRSSATRFVPQPELCILILEDERKDAEAIELRLCAAKLSFVSARADGRGALARALEEMAPDLVIATSRSADIDGSGAIKLIQEKSPGLPVIVIADDTGDATRRGVNERLPHKGRARLIEHLKSDADELRLRRQAERELAFNAAVLNAEHEASPDGILVVDQNERIVSFNRRFIELWGIPPELVASRIDRPVLDAVIARVADEEGFIARVRNLYQRPEEKATDEIVLKDGRTFHRYTAPMTLGDRYIGRVWFFHDITPYKKAEAKISEDATQFRGLVEQDLAGVFILNAKGQISHVNPRFLAMLGYSREEVLGKPVSDYIFEDDRPEVLHRIEMVMSGAIEHNQVEASLYRKDGTLLPILGHGTRALFQGEPSIIGVTLDISELKQAQETLVRLNRVQRTLSSGNGALVHAVTEPSLLQDMCRVMIDVGGYKFAWIGYAQHDEGKSIKPVAWAGHDARYVESLKITWADDERGRGPTGTAVRTGKVVVNQNFATNADLAPWRDQAISHGYGSSIALPLNDGATTFGSITIYAAEPDAFNAEEVDVLTELAGYLAYGVISLRARVAQEESSQRLRRSMQATVLAIASTLEMRDPYTAGHQREVAKLSVAIARELGIPEDDIQGIYLAGVVHDIGKIQIPAEILAKPGKLSKLEFQLVQTHAQAGYDIIKGVEFPWPVADMILQHHERLDGSGYPNGLKADKILIGAKIIAVADVVQAMTAHRPYRAALGLDAALAEIERGKGTMYDTPAVDACIALFRSKGFKFEPGDVHVMA